MLNWYTAKYRAASTILAMVLMLAFAPLRTHAQLTVNPGVSAAALMSALVGQGLTVSNVTINCPTQAYGTFSNGNTTNIGINQGIMLTTGSCATAVGPNNSASAGVCNGTSGSDPQLTAIEPLATEDLCIIEFDVVPHCNQLTISFVFGSEEYPEFVNASYNDAFGFFISGPGPACQANFYNNTNVATLPNNTTPVSIDNVNAGNNAAYYVDNTGGATIQYDAFTTVLTRNIALCPCQTYHWKLAIADAGDCIYDSGVFIDFISCTTALNATVANTPSGCSGCTGTATVNATGPGPFTYNWSPAPGGGQGTANATGLCPGTYSCVVDDAISCSPPVTVTTVIGSVGGSMTVAASQQNVVCNGQCNGTATASVTGGSPPIVYNWTPAPGGGQGTNTATGLCPGTYTCNISDNAGCTTSQTFTITQPPPLTATTSSTPSSCGNPNGSLTVTAGGGAGGYQYLWTPGNYTTSTVNNVSSGSYNVTVTDANGCTQIASVTVGSSSAIASTNTVTNVLCNGQSTGSATVNVTGNNGSVTYVWNPSVSTTNTASNLAAGTYVVTSTDATGCSTTTTVTITEPTALAVPTTSTQSTCGNNNGSVTANPTGGAGGYQYLWTPGNYTTSTVNNLAPGNYNVVVTDANGCTQSVNVTVGNSSVLSTTQASTDVDCFGAATGAASITVTGNNGNVTYVWNPGVSTTNSATNITAGTYVVTATDATGCSSTETITITEPPQLTLTAGGFNVTCDGACDGQIVVIPTGGSPNYTFLWNTGCTTANCNSVCAGNYNVTVTDANGCISTATTSVTQPPAITITSTTTDANCGQSDGSATASASGGTGTFSYQWIGGPATQTYSNIPQGTYSVVVTDQNGCDDTLAVTINNLNGVTASLDPVTNVDCFGGATGAVSVTVTGGNPSYTYVWSAPASSTTNVASGLTAGNYQVTVTDALGCTFTVNATVTEPPQLTMTASANPAAVCEGTPVQLSATPAGGTPGYSVVWTPGGPGNTISVVPTVTGTYQADVTDANGCTATASVNVTVNAIPSAALSANIVSGCAPLCVNFTDISTLAGPGTITSWSWDFGDNSTSTVQDPSHCYNTPGVYTVTLVVTTGDGCTNTITMANYINVYAIPVAGFTAGPQPATILSPEIFFTDTSTNAASWQWSFGDISGASSILQNPSFLYPDPTCYQVELVVTSANGCTDTTEQIVCIDPDVAIFVPNAFTPTADGINDVFIPVTVGFDPEKYEFWVFDRWGNLIFYTDDINKGWDGKVQGHEDLCQIDTYVWKVKAYDVLGHRHNLIGRVSLIK